MRTVAERESAYEHFWIKFNKFLCQNYSPVLAKNTKLRRYDGHYYLGHKCNLSATIVPRRRNIGVEVFIPNGPKLFEELFADKMSIEHDLKLNLDWQSPKEYSRVKARIAVELNGVHPLEKHNQISVFEWIKFHLEKLHLCFAPRISAIMGPYTLRHT